MRLHMVRWNSRQDGAGLHDLAIARGLLPSEEAEGIVEIGAWASRVSDLRGACPRACAALQASRAFIRQEPGGSALAGGIPRASAHEGEEEPCATFQA